VTSRGRSNLAGLGGDRTRWTGGAPGGSEGPSHAPRGSEERSACISRVVHRATMREADVASLDGTLGGGDEWRCEDEREYGWREFGQFQF
jgi:hypothetical protein